MKMATEIRTFGNYIRDLREKSNLTLKEVAIEISVDPSLLAKIERSERQPTKEFIERIAAFFKVESKLLKMEFLSDLIAYKILDEDADIATLKVAESKVSYLKSTRK
jgi:transcriptional regulator with XRE-family HTH domain